MWFCSGLDPDEQKNTCNRKCQERKQRQLVKKYMHMLFGGIKPVCFQSVFFNRSLAEDRGCGAQEWEYRHDVTKDSGEITVERLRAN